MRKHTSNQHNRDDQDERKILGIMMSRKKLITLGVTGIAALGLAGGATAYMIGDKPTDTTTPASSKTTTPSGKKTEKSLTSKDGKKDTKESDKPTEKNDDTTDKADKDSKESKTDTKKGDGSKNDKGTSDSKKSGSSESGSKSNDSKSGGGSSSGSGSSGGSKTSGNSGGSKSSGGGKSSGGSTQPTHTHVYNIPITQTKTIHHDAVYQTKQIPAVQAEHRFCSGCGADLTVLGVTLRQHSAPYEENGDLGHYGSYTKYVTVQPARTEQVLVSEAWDEQQTVTVGYKCSCGARQ